jgi:hypothetical protein
MELRGTFCRVINKLCTTARTAHPIKIEIKMGILLTTIFQIAIFFFLWNLNWFLGQLILEKSEYPGQFIVVTSTVIFTFLIAVNNLLMRIVNRKWFDRSMTLITIILYFSAWAEDLDTYTFNAVIFIIAGVVPILLKKKIEIEVRKRIEYN